MVRQQEAIVVSGVAKSFGTRSVLSELHLSATAGQKIAVIGSSGSGKTTILRILAGLVRPDAGRVELEGQKLWDDADRVSHAKAVRAARRVTQGRVGIVFQQFNLFPHLRVIDNLTIGPVRGLGRDKGETEELAYSLLESVGLRDRAKAYPHQLSGGQQQRVAITRALTLQPSVMLFDEITSALDPEMVGEVLQIVRNLAANSKITMLLSTHEMQFARDVADRVIFLDSGKILEDSSPDEFFVEPKTDRAKKFLSSVLHR